MKFLRENNLEIVASCASLFNAAHPYPHIVLDDFFDDDALSKLLELYPNVNDRKWWVYDNPLERKHAFNDLSQLDPLFSSFFDELASNEFIACLEELTGLHDLLADPTLYGAGLHQILPGGKLDVHEDFNIHRELRAFRKLNVITFLNKDWSNEYKGDLQLWNADMSACARSIEPIFNRVVIFRTDMSSNHGHPEPLICPPDRSRKSLATYYYVRDDSIDAVTYRSTLYKRRACDPIVPELERLREERKKGRV